MSETDSKAQLLDASRQIREALRGLRESVVQAVMRRNMLDDQVKKLDRLIADLETKATLAEKINKDTLAAELRQERQARLEERERLRALLTNAEAEAESAKMRLPEDEARLMQQANALKAQFAQIVGAQLEANTGSAVADTESLWDRAADKIRTLESEASARSEVAGVGSMVNHPVSPAQTPDQSAEELLTALEDRLHRMQPAPEIPAAPAPSPEPANMEAAPPEPALLTAEPPAPEIAAEAPFPALEAEPAPPLLEAEPAPTLLPAEEEAPAPEPEAELKADPEAAEEAPGRAEPIDAGEERDEFAAEEPTAEPSVIVVEAPVDETATETTEEVETPPSLVLVTAEEDAPVEAQTPSMPDLTWETTEEAADVEPHDVSAPALALETETAAQPAAPQFTIVTRPQGESARMKPTQRVRVAGIGTGGIFRGAHLPAYLEIPQMQLVALCDPDPEAQDLAYRRFQTLTEAKIKQAQERNDLAAIERLERDLENVFVCEDIRQVIETIKPDVMDICTQPLLHVPLSIQALEAGSHVMTEKPISRSWLESERLIAAIQRTGQLYQHNENWFWERDYYTAKKLLDTGAIGEPVLMFLAQAHGGPEGNGRFWNPDNGGGGALLDNGIHAIGAAWFVVGLEKQPTLVKAAEPFGMSIRMPDRIIDGRFQKVTVDDDAHILIRFEDAKTNAWVTAHVEGSWSERDSPDTAIIGTTGRIVFKNEDGQRYAIVRNYADVEVRRLPVSGPTWQPWPSSHYGEILNFVECVRTNTPSICTAEFGADNSAIVGASYLSEMRGKQAVHIDEFKAFAREIADRYPDDPKGADDALVEALLSAVRNK